jgi:hypothetical protein
MREGNGHDDLVAPVCCSTDLIPTDQVIFMKHNLNARITAALRGKAAVKWETLMHRTSGDTEKKLPVDFCIFAIALGNIRCNGCG